MEMILINSLCGAAVDISILIVFIILLLNRKWVLKRIKSLEKKEILIFLLLIAFASLIFVSTNAPFMPSDQEWRSLALGKQLSEGDYSVNYLGRYVYGMLYPILIRDFIWIFGATPEIATMISFLSFLVTISSIFIISKVFFRSHLAGILTVLLFMLSPQIITFFSIEKGHPGLSLAFFSLSLALFSLVYKKGKAYLYLLALLSIILVSQIKLENGVILYIFLLGLVVFRGLDPRKYLKSIKCLKFRNLLVTVLIVLIFLSLFSPYVLKGIERQKSYEENGFVDCGLPKYEIEESPLYINKTIPDSLKFVDSIIKSFTNKRFGLDNLSDEKIFTFNSFYNHPFFFLVIFGSVLSLIGIRTRWREILFLVLAFLIHTCMYLLDCNFFVPRYGILTVVPLFVLSGYGFYKLGELFGKMSKQRKIMVLYIFAAFVIISALSLSLNSGLYGKTYQNRYSYAPKMTNLIEKTSRNPIVLTSHFNDMFKFKFFSDFRDVYTIEDLLYKENPEFGTSYMEVYYGNKTLAKEILVFPFSADRDNFFVHGGSCLVNDYHKEGCEKIFEVYETEEIMKSGSNTLYRISV